MKNKGSVDKDYTTQELGVLSQELSYSKRLRNKSDKLNASTPHMLDWQELSNSYAKLRKIYLDLFRAKLYYKNLGGKKVYTPRGVRRRNMQARTNHKWAQQDKTRARILKLDGI